MEQTPEEREAAEAEKRMAEHREKVRAHERLAAAQARDEQIARDLAAHGAGEGVPVNGPSVAVAFSEDDRKAMLEEIERDQRQSRSLVEAQIALALAETELAVASLALVNAQLEALKAR